MAIRQINATRAERQISDRSDSEDNILNYKDEVEAWTMKMILTNHYHKSVMTKRVTEYAMDDPMAVNSQNVQKTQKFGKKLRRRL